MKVVVLGAGGLLGRHVVEELRGHDVLALTRRDCDVGDLAAVRAAVSGRELVINCAAFTNVDGAESDADGAYRANTLGAEHAARAAREHGAALVHVSTDFVFDGTRTEGYDELDAPNPISVYGRSKWAGERLIDAAGGRVFIARVQALYGASGANFASRLRELVAAKKPLKLDRERRVQPTWARAAARQLVALAETDHYGTYHVACTGSCTWVEFAAHLATRLGVPPAWEAVPTSELRAPAARPASSIFVPRMLTLRNIHRMPTWQSALDGYLDEAAQKENR